MKKCFYLVAVLLLMAACTPKNTYTITGVVEEGADGDTIILFNSPDGTTQNIIQTAIIENGKYTIKGSYDSVPNIYFLAYEKNGIYMPFILEAGEIEADIYANNIPTGTLNNNIMKAFEDSIKGYISALQGLYQDYSMDSTLTDEQKATLDDMMAATQARMNQGIESTIANNMDKVAGLFMLSYYGAQMEMEHLDSLLNLVPEEYRTSIYYKQHRDAVDAYMRTAVGQPFIDFEMNDIEGEPMKLSFFVNKNKVTLVDFWASWCVPCREAMPGLVEILKTYKSKGFGIVGVSLDTDATAWKDAVRDLRITWPQLSDLKGGSSPVVTEYGFSVIPTLVLIAQDGTILAKGIGEEELKEKLQDILK